MVSKEQRMASRWAGGSFWLRRWHMKQAPITNLEYEVMGQARAGPHRLQL